MIAKYTAVDVKYMWNNSLQKYIEYQRYREKYHNFVTKYRFLWNVGRNVGLILKIDLNWKPYFRSVWTISAEIALKNMAISRGIEQ